MVIFIDPFYFFYENRIFPWFSKNVDLYQRFFGSFLISFRTHEQICRDLYLRRKFEQSIILLTIFMFRNSSSHLERFWSNMQFMIISRKFNLSFPLHSTTGVTFPLTNAAIFLDHVISLHQKAAPAFRNNTGERFKHRVSLLIKLWNPNPQMWRLMKCLMIIWYDLTCWGKLF